MDRLEKRKQLDIQFEGEEGTGLGPTYEFFSKLAQVIGDAHDGKMWRRSASDGTLFPSPIDVKALEPAKVKEIQ